MHLEDLRWTFGGRIHESGQRRWLDADIGGLRAFAICRSMMDGRAALDLAVSTPDTRELDPFSARCDGREWHLNGDLALPRLRAGFVFEGCHGGVLFAFNHDEPSLESTVSALQDLARWAREPWTAPEQLSEERANELRVRARASMRAHIWRERWIGMSWAIVFVALVLWLRSVTGWS
jgi:hypothetical protein